MLFPGADGEGPTHQPRLDYWRGTSLANAAGRPTGVESRASLAAMAYTRREADSLLLLKRRYTWLVLLARCLSLCDTNASELGVRIATADAAKAMVSRTASPITIDGALDEPA